MEENYFLVTGEAYESGINIASEKAARKRDFDKFRTKNNGIQAIELRITAPRTAFNDLLLRQRLTYTGGLMDNTLLSPPPEPSSSAALAWVEKDIRWYRRQANKKMLGYQFVTFSQILISLLITAAAIALGPEHLKLVAGLLGALVAALGTVAQAFGFQQDWVRWRATQLKLKAEQDLFFFRSSPYSQFGDQADAEQKRIALLVERCTTITGQEFGQWSTAVTASKKAPSSSANGSV